MRAALAYRASASSTPSPIPATSTSNAALARHRSKRQRWRTALALAASVTLAVGAGLRWQASRPVPELPTPAAAVPATAASDRISARPAAEDRADRVSEGSFHDLAQRPACASADDPTSAEQVARRPAPSLQELAPAAMPAPVSAPLPAPVVTPPASAPSAETVPAQPATVSEPAQDDAQLAMAPPPSPAPSAASNDDVQANGALEARTDSSAATPSPAKRAPAPAAAPTLLPAPSLHQSSRIERTATHPPAANEIPIARAPPAAPVAAPVLQPERQFGKPQPDASRATSSPQAAGHTATQQAQPPRVEGTRGETHRTAALKLSTSPREWLAGYAASGGTQTPETLRIMARMPNAVAVQTWVTQLHAQLRQPG